MVSELSQNFCRVADEKTIKYFMKQTLFPTSTHKLVDWGKFNGDNSTFPLIFIGLSPMRARI
jgi:hypothetical protein